MPTNWTDIVNGDKLTLIAKERKVKTIQEKVSPDKIEQYLNKGWSKVNKKPYANGSIVMERSKDTGALFENEVWMIFYKMGFKCMNSTENFVLYNPDNEVEHKQIDIIAVDDEVCLLIECKATAKLDNKSNWKTDLESINGNQAWMRNAIKKQYPNRKIKYIFATKNYVIGEEDSKRMDSFKIANFDYETIIYYNNLADHLGSAGRYQLLGSLFAKTEIANMEERVPAIEGTMGGLKYYTFVIEPERLLKIAYILHRNKANHRMMPTYQRLIKKDRLKAIKEFVNNNGYFPNSIIVSIDTDGKGLKFDQAQAKIEGSHSKIGILHLPKKYRTAYVIDGQHRLYGYSDSNHSSNNSIPVVAFVDMGQANQVKMFMDINENQKSVSKSLRNTLNIDLLWDAYLYSDQLEALMLNIGQELGEDSRSPLYQRVVTGEDTKNTRRCITLDYIKDALKQSNFFNTYKKKKNEIDKHGTFDKMNNDATMDMIYPYLSKCLSYIKNECEEEWDKGSEGFLTINNTIFAVIKIINVITNIVLKKQNKEIVDDINSLYKDSLEFLKPLTEVINELSEEKKAEIKKSYGGGGKNKTCWILQIALREKYPIYTTEELEKQIAANSVADNPLVSDYLTRIETKIKNDLKEYFSQFPNWMSLFVPENVRKEIISKKANANYELEVSGSSERRDEWNFISFDEIVEIAKYQSNWSSFCQNILIKDGMETGKANAINWLKSFSVYKKQLEKNKSILSTQFKEVDNIFKLYFKENDEAI